MWRELIQDAAAKAGEEARFAEPASEEQLLAAEARLGVALPPDLRALLSEGNGVNLDAFASLWSAEELVARNLEMRTFPEFDTLYMPFDCLLFFADEGNGDLFGYRILAGRVDDLTVFEWDHELDSRTAVAFRLEQFIEQWFTDLEADQ